MLPLIQLKLNFFTFSPSDLFIGTFKFLWCDEVDDFTNSYEYADPVDMKEVIKMYSNKNLEAAIRNGGEIMVKCKEYYAVSNYFLDLGYWAAQGFGKWDD